MEIEQIDIDNITYNILDEIDYEDTTYIYLQNNIDERILIKKVVNDQLIDIDDDEVKKAFIIFSKKQIQKDA